MKSPSLLLATLLALAAGHAAGEDWARIAAETDEPGYALRVDEVLPDSEAARIGLRPGDLVYQVGEICTRAITTKRRQHDETLFFCRAGGRKETATVSPGRIGFRGSELFRPQLDYLRGEIGSADPRWDEAAVAALALLDEDPKAAEQAWAEVKALGYPADELDAFLRAYCGWRLRRHFDPRPAWEAIEREYVRMPHLYAALLEDLAYASGQTGLLRKLHDFDPDSSLLDERSLDYWGSLSPDPPPHRRLLSLARERRGRSLVRELAVLPDEEDERVAQRLAILTEKGRFNPAPGRYSLTKFNLPEDVRDFHLSFAFSLRVHGFHERHGSFVRIAARTGEDEEAAGNRLLAELETGTNERRSTWLSHRGGGHLAKRYRDLLREPVPIAPPGDADDEEMSRPFRIDLVRIGGEIAAYLDGVAYFQLPVDPRQRAERLDFFATGIEVRLTDVQVWKLDE